MKRRPDFYRELIEDDDEDDMPPPDETNAVAWLHVLVMATIVIGLLWALTIAWGS